MPVVGCNSVWAFFRKAQSTSAVSECSDRTLEEAVLVFGAKCVRFETFQKLMFPKSVLFFKLCSFSFQLEKNATRNMPRFTSQNLVPSLKPLPGAFCRRISGFGRPKQTTHAFQVQSTFQALEKSHSPQFALLASCRCRRGKLSNGIAPFSTREGSL